MSVSGQNNTVGAPGEGSAQRTGIENWLVAAEQNFFRSSFYFQTNRRLHAFQAREGWTRSPIWI